MMKIDLGELMNLITINNLKIKLPEKEYSKALKNLNEVFVKIGNIDYNLINKKYIR